MKAIVEVRFMLEVDMPDDMDDEQVRFRIEDDSDPATGPVGTVIRAAIEKHDNDGICWACAINAHNKLVEIKR